MTSCPLHTHIVLTSRPTCQRSIFWSVKVAANYQDQHSFPTRRSSDLRFAHDRHVPHTAERHDIFDGRERIVDRKSTRLNSSHLGISYAVFCLKKKYKRHRDGAPTTVLIATKVMRTLRTRPLQA